MRDAPTTPVESAAPTTATVMAGRTPLLDPVLRAARRTLLFGGALLAITAVPLLSWQPPVRAGALLAIALGGLLATAVLTALIGAASIGRGREGLRAVPLQRVLTPPVVLIGGAALLVAGGLAALSADEAAREEARAAAVELASVGARLLATNPPDRVLPLLAPEGGSATLAPPLGAGEGDADRPDVETCRRGRSAMPCAAELVPDRGLLVVTVPARSLKQYLGLLLLRSGVVLLGLLFLGGLLLRSTTSALELAARSVPRGDAPPSSAIPDPVAGALLARRRADRAARRATSETHPPDLLRRVGTELRTPVAEIDAQAGLLQASERLTPAQAEDVSLIRAAAAQLSELLDAVLDFSSLQTSRAPLVRAPVDLAALVSEVARGMRPQMEHRGIGFALEAPPDLPAVQGDARRLRQVITNLVGNAVKFSEHGTVTVTLSSEEGAVMMAVRDEGPGIADEALPLLFHPFEQVAEGRDRAGGSGLGLTITRRIVEAHGGAVTVDSELGRGATFRVRLPIDGRGPRSVA